MEKKKIAILSNITTDLIKQKLRKNYEVYLPEGFDTWLQEVLRSDARIYSGSFDAIVVLLDGTEARNWKSLDEARERMELWQHGLMLLESRTDAIPVFASTLDIRENRIRTFGERKWRLDLEREWYAFLQDLAEKSGHFYVLDLADRIADLGRERAYSDKMWYMSSMPYSREGLQLVCEEIQLALSSAFLPRKKIVVLDLDNTLWGGVIGEDGLEGIELSEHKEGQRFYDFQRQLLEMKKRGVLLAVNSKNNPEDARQVFREHPSMLIHEEDLVAEKINWSDKAGNIKEMEKELNLTESSFVFLDDNPMEREIVKGECPEVLIPEFPEDTSYLRTFAEELYRSNLKPLRLVKEDLDKTEQYHAEAKRNEEKKLSLNMDEYLKRLEIQVDIHPMRPEELGRTAQLCGKTNQFNLTTKRYTEEELSRFSADPLYTIYTVHARDKYGDNGLIAVLILKDEGSACVIDTFLMSCRVMGRMIEEVLIDEIASMLKTDKEEIRGCYLPTAKNQPVSGLYDRLGFELLSGDGEAKQYVLKLSGYRKKDFPAFAGLHFESKQDKRT